MGINLFGKAVQAKSHVVLPEGYHERVRWLPHIGDIFPNFDAETTQGDINFYDWADGYWVLFLSFRAASTPVCTTELASFAAALSDFEERGVKVVGLATDRVDMLQNWVDDTETLFNTPIKFPLVSDTTGEISTAFGLIHPKEDTSHAIRKTFIISPCLKIRMMFEYPMSVGRGVEEVLRVTDALQVSEQHDVRLPADWFPGDPSVVPDSVSDTQAQQLFGDSWRKITSFLRTVDADRVMVENARADSRVKNWAGNFKANI